jgi:hypothetical protein
VGDGDKHASLRWVGVDKCFKVAAGEAKERVEKDLPIYGINGVGFPGFGAAMSAKFRLASPALPDRPAGLVVLHRHRQKKRR